MNKELEYKIKTDIEQIIENNNLEFWITVIDDPEYDGEPLDESDFKLVLSKESAIHATMHHIRNIYRRERITEIDNATVDGLSSEQVSKIIKKELTDKHMVKVNAITFHIVETRFYI